MDELEDLRERVSRLARDKSLYKLASDVLTELAGARTLDEVVRKGIETIMNAWGGANVIIYYRLASLWHRCDAYERIVTLEALDDPSVRAVIESGEPREVPEERNPVSYIEGLPHLGEQDRKTWIFPLKTAEETMGAVEMEGVYLEGDERVKDVIGVIANYLALALRNEIFSEGMLMTANRALTREIKERIRKEEQYRKTVESSFDGFWLVSGTGRFLEVNENYCEMSGYTREELLGMNIIDVELEEARESIENIHIKKIKREGKGRFESRHRRKDGSVFDLELNVVYTEEGDGRFYAFLRDITERKKAEKEKKRLEEQYFQAQKVESIGRLAGGVAHDLNNLLTPILGYSDLLSRELDSHDTRKEYVDEVMQAGLRARDLVHQLLVFSKKQTLEFKQRNLNNIITGFMKLLKRTIRESIEIRVELESGLGFVNADGGQMEQVIMNLSLNARDAMEDGGLLVIRTENATLGEGDDPLDLPRGSYAVMKVIDNGVGMDRKTKDRVFEPFYTTKGNKGTGLGLATVYGIIKQHGGGIYLKSEPGKGTEFAVYLPQAEEPGEESPEETRVHELSHFEAVILLVEDNSSVRNLAASVLRKRGYRLLTASDGNEALRLIRNESDTIDLLLTDVVMPGMNGKVLSEKARELLPGLKVLFMSGYTDDVILAHDVDSGDVDYLQKPFTVESLTAMVRKILSP